ncbi:MAG: helix-turn-helix transcriptional regulator [Clostridiales bacterium]|jgi:transcriptional regulator with XRE-family HTH domain|nr:helix-turn-helix transcriptional regulator [Clostridiales bacterium]
MKKLREEKNLTQKQVREIIGVKEAYISGYEQNVGEPKLTTLRRLAFFLVVSTDYLLGGGKRREFYVDDVPENIQTMESAKEVLRLTNWENNKRRLRKRKRKIHPTRGIYIDKGKKGRKLLQSVEFFRFSYTVCRELSGII